MNQHAQPVAQNNPHESQNRKAAKHLHEQRNGSLVVEKAGLEKCQARQHPKNENSGEHDPCLIAIVQVGTAHVLEGCIQAKLFSF
jgi:hypothetical protein